MIKFSNTVIYVDDVQKTVAFYRNTFGFEVLFMTDTADFAELDTGETLLSFAAHTLAAQNFNDEYVSVTDSKIPLGIEVTLITDDIMKTHADALNNGGLELRAPHRKPWGQLVSHLRCPAGILLELCSE